MISQYTIGQPQHMSFFRMQSNDTIPEETEENFETQRQYPPNLDTNMSDIVMSITQRISLLNKRNQSLTAAHDNMMTELIQAEPEQIRLKKRLTNTHSNSQDPQVEGLMDFHSLKKVIEKILTRQELRPQLSRQEEKQFAKFSKKNQQFEIAIQQKMKAIQQLQADIQETTLQECAKIEEYEEYEDSLRSILKSKGSLEQAEKIEKQKKQSLLAVRHTREVLQSIKDNKCKAIKQTIRILGDLNAFRQERVNQIKNQQEHQVDGVAYRHEIVKSEIQEFVFGLSELKKVKTSFERSLQKSHYREDKNADKSLSSSRRSREVTNSLEPKPSPMRQFCNNLHQSSVECMYRSSVVQKSPIQSLQKFSKAKITGDTDFYPVSQFHSSEQATLEDITRQYEGIIKRLEQLKRQESEYFTRKEDRFMSNYKVTALQKVYLKGILDLQLPVNNIVYIETISSTISKCLRYCEDQSQKQAEAANLQHKIRSIDETKEILSCNIDRIRNEPESKRNLYHKIEQLISSKQKSQDDCGGIRKQLSQLFALQNTKERQLDSYADIADLDGYKRTSRQIEKIKSEQKQLQSKMQKMMSSTARSRENGQRELWEKINNLLEEHSEIDENLFKVKVKDPTAFLHKIGKRLQAL